MSAEKTGCGQCRQAGTKLFLKGTRCNTPKCPMDKEGATPGQHAKKASFKKLSEYGKQLQEKQKVKRIYGVREAQFLRFFGLASNQKGVTGENLLTLLERRIDNVVFRLKMASSRSQSRQMVVHGHICLNGKVTRSPSLITRPDDVVSIKDSVLSKDAFMKNVVEKRMNIGIKVPEWLELKKTEKRGSVLRAPERSEVSDTIAEHLIVELYSK